MDSYVEVQETQTGGSIVPAVVIGGLVLLGTAVGAVLLTTRGRRGARRAYTQIRVAGKTAQLLGAELKDLKSRAGTLRQRAGLQVATADHVRRKVKEGQRRTKRAQALDSRRQALLTQLAQLDQQRDKD